MRIFTAILALLAFGFGLLVLVVSMVFVDERALQANLWPVAYTAMGLGAIFFAYALAPRPE